MDWWSCNYGRYDYCECDGCCHNRAMLERASAERDRYEEIIDALIGMEDADAIEYLRDLREATDDRG